MGEQGREGKDVFGVVIVPRGARRKKQLYRRGTSTILEGRRNPGQMIGNSSRASLASQTTEPISKEMTS